MVYNDHVIYTDINKQAWRVVPPGTVVDKQMSWKVQGARSAWKQVVEFVSRGERGSGGRDGTESYTYRSGGLEQPV
eukprot:243712-Pyramimonas_sp.AAC.1